MAAENQQKKKGSEKRSGQRAASPRRPSETARKKSSQALSLPTKGKSVGVVRIVGGRFKRTPLAVDDRDGLRPTPDRVRETVFDWLLHFFGGTLEGLTVLDMFAGSGAMGLEAVSRGAAHADIVEMDAKSARRIEAAVEKLKASEATVVNEDVFAFLRSSKSVYDLVFIDPPFAAGLQGKALSAVLDRLTKNSYVYVESPAEFPEMILKAEGYESVRRGKAGMVFYLLARKLGKA